MFYPSPSSSPLPAYVAVASCVSDVLALYCFADPAGALKRCCAAIGGLPQADQVGLFMPTPPGLQPLEGWMRTQGAWVPVDGRDLWRFFETVPERPDGLAANPSVPTAAKLRLHARIRELMVCEQARFSAEFEFALLAIGNTDDEQKRSS